MVTKTQQEFLIGALIGSAIGAATALFLTPLSGAALRRQVVTGFGHLNGDSPQPRKRSKAKASKAVAAHAKTAKKAVTKGKRTLKKAVHAVAKHAEHSL